MKYKILSDKMSKISIMVNEHLAAGWELYGIPFRTGNKVLISGQENYPDSCRYTNECAQAMIKIDDVQSPQG